MKTNFDCFPCFLKQISRTGRLLGMDESAIWALLKHGSSLLAAMDVDNPPPQNAVAVYDMISERSGTDDPFRELKVQSTLHALAIYDDLQARINKHPDPLEAAVKYAACGNVIDYGVGDTYDIMEELETVLQQEFYAWEYEFFISRLEKASWVLYLGDNCGETVFDRLLIETMNVPVTFVVRDRPIINDVTMEDARQAGLDKVSTVISSGCRAPGVIIEKCSDEFRRLYQEAPLIISKGQGNFETLCDESREIFFLFKIKCAVVAKYLQTGLNSMFFGLSSNRISS